MRLLLLAFALLPGGAALAQSASRGELLYNTNCIACHTAQMHWRDNKLAKDITGLEQQVRRWSRVASLNWPDEDVAEVTRFLNRRYYGFPAAARTAARGDGAAQGIRPLHAGSASAL